jgi:phosphoserine phosphatase
MGDTAATETWLTPEEALDRLKERFGVDYHINTLLRKAAAGEIPSEKVGKYRRFVPSLLDAWARGEWTPEAAKATA